MFATAIHPENYRKRMNLLCGQSADVFLMLKHGTYGYHHKKLRTNNFADKQEINSK